MSDPPYRAFRLDLAHQRGRAEELLAHARAGDAAAIARIGASDQRLSAVGIELADAQHAIARELRCSSWALLERHVTAMTQARESIAADAVQSLALDRDQRTLHVRCGSDIREDLRRAGLRGDFYEHSFPYLIGPVREGPGHLEQRARFIASSYGEHDPALVYETVLEDLRAVERRLHASADYDRVVIWSERDCYDQLVLVRLLGHYAVQRRPSVLELINVADFPGTTRFIGLGQLPPEALRLLWSTRSRATEPALDTGLAAWRALSSTDPRALAAIARSGTPALPLLAPALQRHLQELPAATNGLSFTQALALDLLAQRELSLSALFGELTYRVDPLPGQGDWQVSSRVLAMEHASTPLIVRRPGVDRLDRSRPPWTDLLSITDAGRAVLCNEIDYCSLAPPRRWVGGVEVGGSNPDWRWDEATRDVALAR